MIGLTQGRWKELPDHGYSITFPYDYLASYFERELEGQLGVNVTVDVTAFSMGGTQFPAEDTINGRMNLKLSLKIPSHDLSGTVGVNLNFTGTRAPVGYLSGPQSELSRKSPLGENLGQYLKEILAGH